MLLKNKKIAIIGAGPVGLTMAKLLQQEGIEVNVYERDKDALIRVSGGPLDLHKGSGQEALKKAGLLERYYSLSLPMGRTIADEHGKVLFSKKPTAENQYDNPEINRNNLRKLLLNSLAKNTVVWDRKFIGLEEQNGKWLLQFENGTSASADFVIGANGGMSKAREYVTDAEIEYTGTVMIQADVMEPEVNCPAFYQLCDSNILMTSDKSTLLVANPKNGNALSYGVTLKNSEESVAAVKDLLDSKDQESIINFLLNRCSNWHESYKQLFRSTSSFVVLKTRKIPLEKPWKDNRPLPITLIGDAAHIMPPFAGQGVNTGLMDALILSENLIINKFETIETAIKDYERKMFVYAKEAQNETSRNEIALHHPDFSFGQFHQ